MKYKSILVVTSLIMLAGFLWSISLLSNTTLPPIDLVYLNDVVKCAEKQVEYTGEKLYSYEFVNLTDTNYSEKMNLALKNRDSVLPVSSGEAMVGSMIFHTGSTQLYREQQQTLFLLVTTVFILLFLVITAYILLLYSKLYKPFAKLERFAKAVAAGNLDLPLTMDKKNAFGAFTESFDLMREELKTAKYKENLANISKRELIASLSHDIKTPVSSIKAVSELLLAMTKDENYIPKLNTIIEKSEQIDRLITDMFHATLEELGELSVIPVVEYSALLYELVSASDYEGRATILDIPDCMIEIDKLRLGQVLDNIFANSYKYANSSIFITCRLIENYLEMELKDFGEGVKEEELSLILNKFYRGSNSTQKTGSGLGLYISKYLMNQQNGDIICQNNEDGFSVKLTLKLAR